MVPQRCLRIFDSIQKDHHLVSEGILAALYFSGKSDFMKKKKAINNQGGTFY